MNKYLILYTMQGCPHCLDLKNKLIEESIEFIERDIEKHEDEYNLFVEVTENDFVPSFMIITDDGEKPKSQLFAPGNQFNSIEEGFQIIKKQII